MTHTPGPWIVQKDNGTATQPFSVYSQFCSTWADGKYTDDPVTLLIRRESDAQLIAAAPDLLEACEAWHSYSEHARLCDVKPQHHKSLGDVVCADCFKLEVTALKLGARAIAKAKGETIDE